MASIPELQNQINRLFSLGEIKLHKSWMNYLDRGFKESDISDLIKIATDTDLYWDDATWYIPVHAWRALGQLKAQDAVIALINCFENLNESNHALEDLSKVMGKIGKSAIPALAQYLTESLDSEWSKITASTSLENIAKYNQKDQEIFNLIVEILTSYLKKPDIDKIWLNGFVVSTLCDLNKINKIPVQTIEIIRQIYKNELAELSVIGDIEEVEIELGIRKERDTPISRYWDEDFEDEDFEDEDDNLIDFNDIFLSPNMPAISSKIGRNDSCYCGSGKKYKKCCLLSRKINTTIKSLTLKNKN